MKITKKYGSGSSTPSKSFTLVWIFDIFLAENINEQTTLNVVLKILQTCNSIRVSGVDNHVL